MDPVANLAEQLDIANRIANDPDYPHGGDIYADTERLAELVLALDEWMRNGGFSPWGEQDPHLERAAFFTHIREGIAIVKDWWRKRK